MLDLASLKSIEAFVASYGTGPLDILVLPLDMAFQRGREGKREGGTEGQRQGEREGETSRGREGGGKGACSTKPLFFS